MPRLIGRFIILLVVVLPLLLSISCTQVSAGKIAFCSTREDPAHGIPSLYVMDPDGTNQVKIAPMRSYPIFCWSPDGARIVFADDKWVCLVNADGTNLSKLAEMPGIPEVISWSPDGSKLAVGCFEGYKGEGNPHFGLLRNIYTVEVETGKLENLTNSHTAEASCPSWSPDGKRLAFTVIHRDSSTNEFTHFDICLMDADGSNFVTLISEPGLTDIGALDWQPNGENVLYTFCPSEKLRPGDVVPPTADICVVDARDGSKMNLTNNPDARACYPAWSPDGKKIVFVSSQRVAGPQIADEQIYVMNADGSHLTGLTDSDRGKASPSWSPDGRRIAFTVGHGRDTGDTDDINVMDADGSNVLDLTGTTPGDDYYCVWSPK